MWRDLKQKASNLTYQPHIAGLLRIHPGYVSAGAERVEGGEMLASVIVAMALQSNAGAGSDMPADIPPTAPVYAREDLKRFSIDQHYYPQKARAARVDGSAVVDCQVEPDGRLSRCAVLGESPPGMGFGEAAALIFLKYAKLDSNAMQAYPQGGWKKFKYVWSYDQWAMAQDKW